MEAIVFRSFDIGRLAVAEAPRWLTFGRPSVYLDSTIPSYACSVRSRDTLIARNQRITRIWWHRYRRDYELLVSDRVIEEVSIGMPVMARRRLSLIRPIRLLAREPHYSALVELLLRPGILPEKARADAEHIAMAAYNSVRFLLTWNCKHLANPIVARKVARACEARGLECPLICTPETLMRIYSHERSNHRCDSQDSRSICD